MNRCAYLFEIGSFSCSWRIVSGYYSSSELPVNDSVTAHSLLFNASVDKLSVYTRTPKTVYDTFQFDDGRVLRRCSPSASPHRWRPRHIAALRQRRGRPARQRRQSGRKSRWLTDPVCAADNETFQTDRIGESVHLSRPVSPAETRAKSTGSTPNYGTSTHGFPNQLDGVGGPPNPGLGRGDPLAYRGPTYAAIGPDKADIVAG